MYKVYKHTFPNNKVYIGITKQKPIKRWKNGTGYKNNEYITNAIKKYGWQNIKHEILFSNLEKEEAEKKEIELISFFSSADRKYGYNIQLGGNANKGITEETRKKMRLSHIGKTTKPMPKRLKENHSNFMKEHWKEKKFKEKLLNNLRKKHCIKVKCCETGMQFNSIAEAGEYLNMYKNHIGECLKGKRKTSGGYHWELVGDVNA